MDISTADSKTSINEDTFENVPAVDAISEDYIPTEEEMDPIYRKLDWRIIPACWCLYFLGSYGNSAYANTLTMNYESGHSLIQSLHLNSHHTSVASALSAVANIIFDLPMNLMMTRTSPQVWLSRIITSVGIVYLCYAALEGPKGIMAIRFMSGFADAGTWPGLAYYISLWYPGHRTAKRIGYYFTAAQISASAAGLVAAGFQKMDMVRGLYGWKWYFIVYGGVTFCCGISLIWWLPDRPRHLDTNNKMKWSLRSHLPAKVMKYFTASQPLNDRESRLHYLDMKHRYINTRWGLKDVGKIVIDFRMWPLIMMYFGVVGTGMGLATYATVLIKTINPNLSGIDVSLLYAPIWLFDFVAILIATNLADRNRKFRIPLFCSGCVIIIVGLMVTSFAPGYWSRWGGLLICGFGLGPTTPIVMALATEIASYRYGDIGPAAASAIVSGLGSLGTVAVTYSLYSGWPADKARLYRNSNMILVMILGVAIICAILLWYIMEVVDEGVYSQELRKEKEHDKVMAAILAEEGDHQLTQKQKQQQQDLEAEGFEC